METLKIVLKGETPIKKNGMGKLWFRNVNGRKIPLKVPVMYYKKNYVEWAKQAISTLTVWKINHPEFNLPITEPVILTIVLFIKHQGVRDLTNLVESIQDVLAGNPGNFMDKKSKGKIIPYDHSTYQVLIDDNRKVIKAINILSFDDLINPRAEIYISKFSFASLKSLFTDIHKRDLEEDKQELFLL